MQPIKILSNWLQLLPKKKINQALEQEGLWDFIVYLMEDLKNQIQRN